MNGSDQMPQLIDYIIALTNLYGIVHKNRVQTIYNQQHTEPVTEEELQLILDNPPSTLEKAFVVVYQDYFVHEFIIEERLFDELMLKKGRKPYYIPEKEELLLYIDESYFEKMMRRKTNKRAGERGKRERERERDPTSVNR